MNWCLESKMLFVRDFVQYLLAIGFSIEEVCEFVSVDPELHPLVLQSRMCFSVDVNRIPPTNPKELS